MSQETHILCPGQGAQAVGMGRDFAAAHPAAQAVFDRADAVLGTKLSDLCFDGPADVLNQTDVSQPAIFITSLACHAAAKEAGKLPEVPTSYAGLSLGEYTALHLAGCFDFETGLKLVQARGRYMQEAAVAQPGGMVSLIGADEEQAIKLCHDNAGGKALVPANFNSPGQIVCSGTQEGCDRLAAAATEAGLRAIPLTVAGAFHSPLMESAADRLASDLESITFKPLGVPVWSNVTAEPHEGVDDIKRLLVAQVTAPVRWSQTMQKLAAGADGPQFVELAPGRVLTGLMRRTDRRAPVTTLDTAAALQ
jgi:[acyl-carrier-protein] S-malonyltransferase